MTTPPFILSWPDNSRATLAIRITVGYSILIHALILLIPLRDKLPMPPPPGASGPMTVELEPLRTAQAPAVEPPVPEAAPRSAPRPTRVPLAMPPRARPETPAVTAPPPEPEPVRQPTFDMSALIAANRERRRAQEAVAARGSSPSGGASSDGAADSLARNLASLSRGDDTGGIFQILRIGARTAEFSFNGWRRETRRQWREVIEVDAGTGGDVERAIVRRMIALIREHYTGDFKWESQRAGHVVVLSAAPENNAELEAYLMREFFGTPLVKRGP